ncbi:hypothetical protein BTZ20_5572 [Rhodococcus sp. MTM3W5.2]|nr:hypothetical protein BTZ20_5572 [Rhodococcus sp. MTM3W5.2]
MLLPHHLGEGCRSIFPVEGHAERVPAKGDTASADRRPPASGAGTRTCAASRVSGIRNTAATHWQRRRNHDRPSSPLACGRGPHA